MKNLFDFYWQTLLKYFRWFQAGWGAFYSFFSGGVVVWTGKNDTKSVSVDATLI